MLTYTEVAAAIDETVPEPYAQKCLDKLRATPDETTPDDDDAQPAT